MYTPAAEHVQVSMDLLRSFAADEKPDDEEYLLTLVAGSICKDFSSMGDGARLIGKHVALPDLKHVIWLWVIWVLSKH